MTEIEQAFCFSVMCFILLVDTKKTRMKNTVSTPGNEWQYGVKYYDPFAKKWRSFWSINVLMLHAKQFIKGRYSYERNAIPDRP